MFWYEHKKAEVKILDSEDEDNLAASVFGGRRNSKFKKFPMRKSRISIKRKSRFSMKRQSNKGGVSGYDWDSLI
jgi:hypothetical protein